MALIVVSPSPWLQRVSMVLLHSNGHLYKALLAGTCVIDPLRRFLIILGFGEKDVRYKGLRVSVIERKPTRLYLHHDAMARQENVVRVWESPLVKQRLVRLDGLWRFIPLTVSAAKDVHRDAELVSTKLRLPHYLVGIDIDHLYDPIRIRATCGC